MRMIIIHKNNWIKTYDLTKFLPDTTDGLGLGYFSFLGPVGLGAVDTGDMHIPALDHTKPNSPLFGSCGSFSCHKARLAGRWW